MYEVVPMIITSDLQEDTSRRPLPRELLTEVATYCDPQTLIALSRVCRFLAPVAEYRIWRKLNLFLHPYYGEHPLIQPFPQGDTVEYRTWAQTEARAAEERRRTALKTKVATIINRGNEAKWGMVEEVRVETRQGAVWGMMAILELVAPTVRVLHFVRPHDHPYHHTWRPRLADTLQAKLVDSGIQFNALGVLVLQHNSVRNYKLLAVLANAAPNLHTAVINVSGHSLVPDDVPSNSYPPLRPTNIRKLYLTFHDMVPMEINALGAVTELLEHSPRLKQLSIQYSDDDRVPVSRYLASALSTHQHLRDLHWTISPELLLDIFALQRHLLGKLERLVVQSDNAMETMSILDRARFTNLVSLWFEIPPPANPSVVNWDHTAFPSTSDPANPYLTNLIRESSSLQTLRYIHRDNSYAVDIWGKIASMGPDINISGVFSSFKHDDSELIRACVLMDLVEEEGYELEYVRRQLGSGDVVYDKRKRAGWKEWAELDGTVVPLPIVRRMTEMQGVQATVTWTGRERKVPKEAWRVVEHWMEQEKAHGDVPVPSPWPALPSHAHTSLCAAQKGFEVYDGSENKAVEAGFSFGSGRLMVGAIPEAGRVWTGLWQVGACSWSSNV